MPFTPDTNAIPVSGRCQWPFNTHAISSKTQIQTIRTLRVSATNCRFLLLNNTGTSITFKMSTKMMWNGTWAMVTKSGSETITIPAYTSAHSDVFATSILAGQAIYTRTYHDVSSSTALSSGYFGTGYEPEAVSFTSTSGYSFVECLLDGMSSDRLLEGGTTFEADANVSLAMVQKIYGTYVFSPYAILGVPTTAQRLVTLIGDSKTQAPGPDAAGNQGNQWANIGFGFKTGQPYQNLAVSGDSFYGFLLDSPSTVLRRELLVFGGDYINAYGANSVTNGSNPVSATSAELNDIQSGVALLSAGSRWFQCTIDPRTSLNFGADWATVTDAQQTPSGNGNSGVATANYFNNLIKTSQPVYIDGVIDIAAPVTSTAGFWLAGMTFDGVHQSNAGNEAKASTFAAVWPNLIAEESSSSSMSSASSASSGSSSDSSPSSSISSSSSSSDDVDPTSSSSSNDEQEPRLDTLHSNLNTYPEAFIDDHDLGPISLVSGEAYRYTEVKTFRGPLTVVLDSPYANSEIRYTLNGKLPTPTSPKYVGPLVFRQNATGEKTAIRARIYDKTNSNVKSKIIRLEFRVMPPR